jgi:tetratricopeptide (TPR) repeat protein
MQTKLSIFCDRLMEAGWLLAVIIAPLYFNVYSNRVFEPDKISIIRSIALIMALAWLIKILDTGVLSRQGQPRTAEQQSGSLLQRINRQNILTLPTLALVVIYVISTIASVAPAITLWGSYQRLQGTYSTFSYIVIFFLAAGTISRREQIDRVLTVAILTSIPISVYGMIEHLKLEFLPWGGDVTDRITSTMGNAIFISAYLIMVLPLALGRFLEKSRLFMDTAGQNTNQKGPLQNWWVLFILVVGQAVLWFLLIYFGLSAFGNLLLGTTGNSGIMVILLAVLLLLTNALAFTLKKGVPHYLMAAFYGMAVLVELAAILFSQSRGPQLGLMAGLVVFAFLYAMKVNSRILWYIGLGLATLALLLLALINIPGSPLSAVRHMPYIGRMATIVEEVGSAKVRTLIWQGARQLIGEHTPLEVPGRYTDDLNAIRPLIGYGPDAMYVAYNRFYPPDLAHVEARNASPDRSHNETFDALVMTGILGYLAYWLVFYTVIYVALLYLGVIDERHGRPLYVALLVSALVPLAIIYFNLLPINYSPGPPLIGVLVLGIYLVIAGIAFYDWKGEQRPLDVTLLALVAAIVAHFVEIQFGIAIVSTRTSFWLYAALIVAARRLLRESLPAPAAPAPATVSAPVLAATAVPARTQPSASFSKKKTKSAAAGRPHTDTRQPARAAAQRPAEADLLTLARRMTPGVLPLAVVGGMIMTIMAYNYIMPPSGTSQPRTTPMQFWLYLIAWLSCALVVALDRSPESADDDANHIVAGLIVYTTVSLLMWVGYVGLRGLVLSAQGAQPEGATLVALFYFVLTVYGLALAAALYIERRPLGFATWGGPVSGMVYAAALVITIVLIFATNLSGIMSDVYYKNGLGYDSAQRYDLSIGAYQKAINLAPGQDFYYLFLGRSLMELARQYPDRAANPAYDATKEGALSLTPQRLATLGREDLIKASEQVLLKARDLNPLNTDHYANLGRLYRFWGEAKDPSKFALADQYFKEATSLSPNNAQLWNEWSIVSLLRGQAQDAESKLMHSLELDDQYDLTYFYLGNMLLNQGEASQDQVQKTDMLAKAADYYSSCLKYAPTNWECAKARGYLYGKYLGRPQDAIADFNAVAAALPKPEEVNRMTNAAQKQQYAQELINIHQNLAITYAQSGNIDQALAHAQIALSLAPNDNNLKTLVDQLKQQQK